MYMYVYTYIYIYIYILAFLVNLGMAFHNSVEATLEINEFYLSSNSQTFYKWDGGTNT